MRQNGPGHPEMRHEDGHLPHLGARQQLASEGLKDAGLDVDDRFALGRLPALVNVLPEAGDRTGSSEAQVRVLDLFSGPAAPRRRASDRESKERPLSFQTQKPCWPLELTCWSRFRGTPPESSPPLESPSRRPELPSPKRQAAQLPFSGFRTSDSITSFKPKSPPPTTDKETKLRTHAPSQRLGEPSSLDCSTGTARPPRPTSAPPPGTPPPHPPRPACWRALRLQWNRKKPDANISDEQEKGTHLAQGRQRKIDVSAVERAFLDVPGAPVDCPVPNEHHALHIIGDTRYHARLYNSAAKRRAKVNATEQNGHMQDRYEAFSALPKAHPHAESAEHRDNLTEGAKIPAKPNGQNSSKKCGEAALLTVLLAGKDERAEYVNATETMKETLITILNYPFYINISLIYKILQYTFWLYQ
eukprot:scaffold58_cov256-Pinguiococcus_pyrenoidosus.AAC.18